MLWGYFSLFPLSAMFIVTAALPHSSAVIVCNVLSAISVTVQSFSIYALWQVLRQDTFRFPYGAGKLEDFSAFLCGVLFVPAGLFMAYEASQRLVHPHDVGYLVGLVPVTLSAVRVASLYGVSLSGSPTRSVPSSTACGFQGTRAASLSCFAVWRAILRCGPRLS